MGRWTLFLTGLKNVLEAVGWVSEELFDSQQERVLYLSLQNVQTGSKTRGTSHLIDTVGSRELSFPRCQNGFMWRWPFRPSSGKVNIKWSYTYSPPYAFMKCARTTLPLPLPVPLTMLLPLPQGNRSLGKNVWQMLGHLGHVYFTL